MSLQFSPLIADIDFSLQSKPQQIPTMIVLKALEEDATCGNAGRLLWVVAESPPGPAEVHQDFLP